MLLIWYRDISVLALTKIPWFASNFIVPFLELSALQIYPFLVQGIGCFKDTSRRAITPLEGRLPIVRGNYRRRKKAIDKCALAAARYGYIVFAVQHGGQCFGGPRAHKTYAKYGRSNRCRNGKGGAWANDVYRVSGMISFFLFFVIFFTFKSREKAFIY